MDDERGQLLLDLISRIDPSSTKYFVLNGDIFDFCFGASSYFRNKFKLLGQSLTALAHKGVRVVVVEGNHEFHIDKIGWDGVNFVTERDFTVEFAPDQRIKISHGDTIKYDFWYRLYRGLTKSTLFGLLARLVPGIWVDRLSLRYATASRKMGETRPFDPAPLFRAAEQWVQDGDYNHGIFGHFHIPYAEPRDNGSGKILCVESWDRPNALIFRDGEFYRSYFSKIGEPYKVEPVTPILKKGQ